MWNFEISLFLTKAKDCLNLFSVGKWTEKVTKTLVFKYFTMQYNLYEKQVKQFKCIIRTEIFHQHTIYLCTMIDSAFVNKLARIKYYLPILLGCNIYFLWFIDIMILSDENENIYILTQQQTYNSLEIYEHLSNGTSHCSLKEHYSFLVVDPIIN